MFIYVFLYKWFYVLRVCTTEVYGFYLYVCANEVTCCVHMHEVSHSVWGVVPAPD